MKKQYPNSEDDARRANDEARADEERHNPYVAPEPPRHSGQPSKNPTVFDEPWMLPIEIAPVDPEEPLRNMEDEENQAENSVWDEPSTSQMLSGEMPQDAVTWIAWYRKQVEKTSFEQTVWTTVGVALCSGLAAVFGAFLVTPNAILVAVVAAPVAEEIMKIALAIWVVEKRPWLFSSRIQILLCGMASGFVFACIENVIYLSAYIANPSAQIAVWRWTVCVALHVVCSLIASLGVARVWTMFQAESRMPRLSDGAFFITLAMVMHGTYNLLVTLLEATGAIF